MMLNRFHRARIPPDPLSIFCSEIGEKVLQPLGKRRTIPSELFGVDDDRVQRRSGCTIAFEQPPNVDRLILIRIQRSRKRFERRIELVPFRSAFANLLSKVLRLQFVPQLRLCGNVRIELFDELACVIGEIVESFLLEIAESCEWRCSRLVERGRLGLQLELERVVWRLLLLRLRRAE